MRSTFLYVLSLGIAALIGGFVIGGLAQGDAGGMDGTKGQHEAKGATIKDEVRGGIAFRPEKRTWIRISGKVRVLDAHTLAYEDGTEAGLGGMEEAPELEQKGMIDGKFYPCGKEAAEFLRKLIGDRSVTCLIHRDNAKGKKMSGAAAFIGDTCLNIEMVRSGWAISNHEGMDGFEILARENKRGLWRGTFVVPGRWRSGERLPGE